MRNNRTERITQRIMLLLSALLFSACQEAIKENRFISNNYSDIQKTYFFETALNPEDNRIHKWEKPVINYSIKGNFNKEEVHFIKQTMVQLAIMHHLPKFEFQETTGDITFLMPAKAEDVQKAFGKTQAINGVMIPLKTTRDGYHKKVAIWVKPGMSLLNTEITIQHELMHALGLNSHPKTFHENISAALGDRYFSFQHRPIDTISAKLPDIDVAALSILYHDAVKVGLNRTQTAQLIGLHILPSE